METDIPFTENNDPKYYEKRVKSIIDAIIADPEINSGKADEIIDKIFFKNSERLFFTKNWAKTANTIKEKSKHSTSKIQKVILTFGALAVTLLAGTIMYFNRKKEKNTNQKIFKNKTS